MKRRLPTLPNPEGAEVDYNVNGESDGGSSEEGGVDENVAYHNRLPPQQSLRGGTGDEATVAYDDRARLIEKMTLADKAVITCSKFPTKRELGFVRKKFKKGGKSGPDKIAVYGRIRPLVRFFSHYFLRKIAVKYLCCDGFTMILRLL